MPDLADDLMEHAPVIAAEVTKRMVQTHPDMFEALRANLRNPAKTPEQWCTEDTVHHLQHLSAALSAASPEEFGRYRTWLKEVLSSRGIPTEDIDTNFSAIAWVLEKRYGQEAQTAIEVLSATATSSP